MPEERYRRLIFKYSDTGFCHNIYYDKEIKQYYCLQWDWGYNKPPTLYSATSDGEADCPIRKELYKYFVFPDGHEH